MCIALLAGCTLLLTACGGASNASSAQSAASAPTTVYGGGSGGSSSTSEGITNETPNSAQSVQRKLVANANFTLETKDFDATEKKINDLATSLNGYVVDSTEQENDGEKDGNLSLRVPADKLQSFISGMKSLDGITIDSSSMTSQDVTSNYIDLDARLKAFDAEQTQLNSLMQQAKSVDDVLKITTQLSQVQQQIEQIKGQLQYLQHNVDFSEVTIDISSAGVSVQNPQNAAARAGSTFVDNLSGVGNFFVGLFVFVVGYFPTLLLLFLIGWGIFWLIRRSKRKKHLKLELREQVERERQHQRLQELQRQQIELEKEQQAQEDGESMDVEENRQDKE